MIIKLNGTVCYEFNGILNKYLIFKWNKCNSEPKNCFFAILSKDFCHKFMRKAFPFDFFWVVSIILVIISPNLSRGLTLLTKYSKKFTFGLFSADFSFIISNEIEIRRRALSYTVFCDNTIKDLKYCFLKDYFERNFTYLKISWISSKSKYLTQFSL